MLVCGKRSRGALILGCGDDDDIVYHGLQTVGEELLYTTHELLLLHGWIEVGKALYYLRNQGETPLNSNIRKTWQEPK